MSFRNRYAYPTVALLIACNARLAVMDEPLDGPDAGVSGSGGSAGKGPNGGISGTGGWSGSSGAGGWSGSSGAAGSSGSAGSAGGGAISGCGDSIKNGDETGVDCGGSCAPCAVPCDCAVSEALMPLSCAAPFGMAMTFNRGYPRTDATGDTISFDACSGTSSENPSCRQFIYRSATGISELAPPSGSGRLQGLSADGELALFLPSLTLGTEALVYRSDGSWTETGLAPRTAVMAAGGSAAGISTPKPNGRVDLMRWTAAGGNAVLAELPFEEGSTIYLTGISSDGSVVAGYAFVDDVGHGFIHDPVNGLVIDLGDDLPETATAAQVLALSGTGDAAAGLLNGTDPRRVFYWSVTGGLVDIGPLVADPFPGVSINPHLSTDGSVVAATLETSRSAAGSRWTSAGIAPLIPLGQNTVRAIDADGSTIIGISFDESPQYGLFSWTPETGARSVYAELQAAGVDVTGWVLDEPDAISADGKVVTGYALCGGARTSFRLVLPE